MQFPPDSTLPSCPPYQAEAVPGRGRILLLAMALPGVLVLAGFYLLSLFLDDLDGLSRQRQQLEEMQGQLRHVLTLATDPGWSQGDSIGQGNLYRQASQAVRELEAGSRRLFSPEEEEAPLLELLEDWLSASLPGVPGGLVPTQALACQQLVQDLLVDSDHFLLQLASPRSRFSPPLSLLPVAGPGEKEVLQACEAYSQALSRDIRQHLAQLGQLQQIVFPGIFILLVLLSLFGLRPLLGRVARAMRQGALDHARLAAILDNVRDGVIEVSATGEVVFANRAAKGLLLPPPTQGGKSLVPPLSALLAAAGEEGQSVLEALHQGKACHFAGVTLTRQDGTCLLAALSLSPLAKEEGQDGDAGEQQAVAASATRPGGLLVFRDASRRLRREERLRKLSHAVTFSPAPVIITDTSGLIEYVNPAFCEISGWSFGEVVGRSPSLIRSGAQSREFYQEMWSTLRSGRPWRGEFNNRRRDGSDYQVRAAIAPVRDENQVVTHYVAVQEDITLEKQALNELEANRRRLREAIESLPHGFAIFNPDETLSMCNSAFRSLFQETLSRLPENVAFADIVRTGAARLQYRNIDAGSSVEDYIQQRLANFRNGGEQELALANGRYVLATDSVTPGGDHVCLRADITEIKKIQQELESARQEADRANKAKSDFLSSMSHELRTPLNAILGFAQLLTISRASPLSERQNDQVQQILTAGQHLLALIDEILDLARIESGRFVVSHEPVFLADLLSSCRMILLPSLEERGIQLALPEIPDSLAVLADSLRLKQVLLNLLGNAIKYNRPEGHILVSIVAGAPGCLRLSIDDSGIGIPPERRGEVFQPFSRLGRESTATPGTGIGLSLAYHLVGLMGGILELEDSPLGGVRFVFSLPEAPLSADRVMTVKEAGSPDLEPAGQDAP